MLLLVVLVLLLVKHLPVCLGMFALVLKASPGSPPSLSSPCARVGLRPLEDATVSSRVRGLPVPPFPGAPRRPGRFANSSPCLRAGGGAASGNATLAPPSMGMRHHHHHHHQ